MSELLPCPFCKRKPRVSKVKRGVFNFNRIRCKACCWGTDFYVSATDTEMFNEWNKIARKYNKP
jgi:hypothetical protein